MPKWPTSNIHYSLHLCFLRDCLILLLRIDFDETNLLLDRKLLTTIESPSATIVAMTQVGATSIQSWRKIDTSPSLLGRTSNFKRYIYNVCDIFLFKHAFT